MNLQRRTTRIALLLLLILCQTALFSAVSALAADPTVEEAIRALGTDSRSQLIKAIQQLGALNDGAALPALEALQDKRLLYTQAGQVVIVDEQTEDMRDALTGEMVEIAEDD